jgi:hypothetical protein
VLDLRGPNRPGMGQRAMAKASEPEPAARGEAPTADNVRAMFSFDRPPGWKENPNPSQREIIYEFKADGSAGPALITLSAFPGGGDLASNVNRWRSQAGLEQLPESEVSKVAAPITFLGTDAWLVEAIGDTTGIVAIASLNSQFSIFLKIKGPPATVQAQKETFMKVAQTFKMKGHHD